MKLNLKSIAERVELALRALLAFSFGIDGFAVADGQQQRDPEPIAAVMELFPLVDISVR